MRSKDLLLDRAQFALLHTWGVPMTFAVCVSFHIHEDSISAFLPLIAENAAQSLRDEPGCLQFDVLTDPARPGEVFLYERYTDAAAFDVHLATAHFKSFDAASAPMIASKSVSTYGQVIS